MDGGWHLLLQGERCLYVGEVAVRDDWRGVRDA